MTASPVASAGRHRVVVLGSGFGGLFAARRLSSAPVEVTVVDRTTHHLFQPLLYQVATGILSEGDVAPTTRDILRRQRNARIVLGEVVDMGDITTSILRRRASCCSTERGGSCRPLTSASLPARLTACGRGVEIQTGAMVVGVDAEGIEVQGTDGERRRVTAMTKVWSAGVQASPLGRLYQRGEG